MAHLQLGHGLLLVLEVTLLLLLGVLPEPALLLELFLQVPQLLQLLVVLVPAPAQRGLLPALSQLHLTQNKNFFV